MRRVSSFVVVILLLLASSAGWSSSLVNQLINCSNELDTEKRLACYDALAEQQRVKNSLFIQPDSKFLQSKLTVTPGASDYTLSIQDFVELVGNAVMDDGKKVVVHGWIKEGEHYVLRINMRNPVQLKFLPSVTKSGGIPTGLLLSPTVDGQLTDPELFIMTIASMVPDDDESTNQ